MGMPQIAQIRSNLTAYNTGLEESISEAVFEFSGHADKEKRILTTLLRAQHEVFTSVVEQLLEILEELEPKSGLGEVM